MGVSGNSKKQKHICRGGGWMSGISRSRCASRWGVKDNDPAPFVGFRIIVEE